MIDAFAAERQFIDHLAPVWRQLPDRGSFFTERDLIDHAASRGIEAGPIVHSNWRRTDGSTPALVASSGDTKTARLRGYRRFVSMEHGAGQSYIPDNPRAGRHSSYAGGDGREDTTLFLCPNAYSADLWRARYPAAQVELIGCPKLDTLPAKDPAVPETVAISFHWPGKQVAETDTAFSHFQQMLRPLADAHRLVGHAHPKGSWGRTLASVYARNGIRFLADFEDVCREADVYVCDNSSTLFEFAATGRPVVVLNSPRYRRDVHHGLRFWDAAHVGVQVDHPQDLLRGVARALRDEFEDRDNREDALQTVYEPRRADLAHIVELITTHLAEPATMRP